MVFYDARRSSVAPTTTKEQRKLAYFLLHDELREHLGSGNQMLLESHEKATLKAIK